MQLRTLIPRAASANFQEVEEAVAAAVAAAAAAAAVVAEKEAEAAKPKPAAAKRGARADSSSSSAVKGTPVPPDVALDSAGSTWQLPMLSAAVAVAAFVCALFMWNRRRPTA